MKRHDPGRASRRWPCHHTHRELIYLDSSALVKLAHREAESWNWSVHNGPVETISSPHSAPGTALMSCAQRTANLIGVPLFTRWYTFSMPTTRPRHQITETPVVAHALDVAARQWPAEPRSKLLLRLVQAGAAALEGAQDEVTRNRQAAIDASSGKYADAFSEDYLAPLRQDWPE